MVSTSITLLGNWFKRRMACGENDVLYTIVLVCGTRNHNEWPHGSKRGAVEVVFRWYINKVVHYAVHHHCPGVRSSAL
jgi:hypothetical protein